ncbi:MAG: hypothetical protein PHF05_08355 [Candidatus Izemoplasmatales bacterium]|nr:hypothetical protein [Candidatus Izemoplasmatales bacterium]
MKNELTLEEWKEVGKKAKAVKNANHELSLILGKKFNKTVWEKQWFASDKSFGKLRSHLDDIVCGKFQDLPDNEITHIFYGDENNE